MVFSQSTHLLMFLSLEALMAIIRTGLPTLAELIDLVNCYNFSISNHLTQMVNFPTRIPDCGFHSPALLDCVPVVVLKNCERELSFILSELFSKRLKESCFPGCWKVSSAFPVKLPPCWSSFCG